MNSIPSTDFFASIPVLPDFDETLGTPKVLPLAMPGLHSLKELRVNELSQLERADFFTYVIMGLAVLIAIVVPLLNLS